MSVLVLLNRLVAWGLVMSADVLLLWRCGEDAAVAVRARCKRDVPSLLAVVRKEEKKSCGVVGVAVEVAVVNRSSCW
jgi:hypothetical protein